MTGCACVSGGGSGRDLNGQREGPVPGRPQATLRRSWKARQISQAPARSVRGLRGGKVRRWRLA